MALLVSTLSGKLLNRIVAGVVDVEYVPEATTTGLDRKSLIVN